MGTNKIEGIKNMYAKWIAEDFYVEPNKFNKSLVIAKGEIRKIHAKKDGKNIEILRRRYG